MRSGCQCTSARMLKMCFESCIYDGKFLTRGLRKQSTYCDSLSVGPPMPETMGLPGGKGAGL